MSLGPCRCTTSSVNIERHGRARQGVLEMCKKSDGLTGCCPVLVLSEILSTACLLAPLNAKLFGVDNHMEKILQLHESVVGHPFGFG